MSLTWYGTQNYTPGNDGRLYIFPHICEGWWDGSISTLQNPARQASAHYVVSGGCTTSFRSARPCHSR